MCERASDPAGGSESQFRCGTGTASRFREDNAWRQIGKPRIGAAVWCGRGCMRMAAAMTLNRFRASRLREADECRAHVAAFSFNLRFGNGARGADLAVWGRGFAAARAGVPTHSISGALRRVAARNAAATLARARCANGSLAQHRSERDGSNPCGWMGPGPQGLRHLRNL